MIHERVDEYIEWWQDIHRHYNGKLEKPEKLEKIEHMNLWIKDKVEISEFLN